MASKFILSKREVEDIVSENTFEVTNENHFLSRCIDGRYPKDASLPPVAIPGGDVGELGILYGAATKYGFEIDTEKAFQTLIEVIGGYSSFSYHTDRHVNESELAEGCGYIKQLRHDTDSYQVTKEQLDILNSQIKTAHDHGAVEKRLEGDHRESAVIILVGEKGLYPRVQAKIDERNREVEFFVFNKTLVDLRHKELAKKLVEKGAVTLYDGFDEEYLYEVISDVTDDQLFETTKRLAVGLPIYIVTFDSTGNFTVEDQEIL